MPNNNFRKVNDLADEIKYLHENGDPKTAFRQALRPWSRLTKLVKEAPDNEQPVLHHIMVETEKLLDEMKRRAK
ncbi:MAG: hypothetical protein C4576_16055 [Desulfobacteraceae bacterium]|nr:MAG: hypothetical protein C4576_16055 [Desulfobacteraceae bacterium]